MTNFIYMPYFYIIQEVSTGMYYAGSKWGKNANPNIFMKENGYITSSDMIRYLISKNGIESFVIRKIKIFDTKEAVYDYETKFLQKINARKHLKFYNGHNNDFSSKFLDIEGIMVAKYGVKNPFQLKHVREKVKSNNIDKYGVEYPLCSKHIKEKSTYTLIERYGVENPFQIDYVREKRDKAMLKKYGTTCSLELPEIREKAKTSMEERYGCKYASQIPEIKERKRNLQKEKSDREPVKAIRRYCYKFNLKLGPGWYLKSNEYIEQKLEELIEAYGIIAPD